MDNKIEQQSSNKFNINDEVYFLHENKVKKELVKQISLFDRHLNTDNTESIEYCLKNIKNMGKETYLRNENQIFKSREELTQSLLKDEIK